MKPRKVLIVLLLPGIAEILIACCECVDPVFKNYANQSFSVNNLDNSGNEPVVTSSGRVSKETYGISLLFQREIVAANRRAQPSFFSSAQALSCVCPPELQLLPKDNIESIKILTLNNFDLDHPANSDVSVYFTVFRYNYFVTIEDYLNAKDPAGVNGILYDESQLEWEVFLLLMTPPQTGPAHRFVVQITFLDGRVLVQETTGIDLI